MSTSSSTYTFEIFGTGGLGIAGLRGLYGKNDLERLKTEICLIVT